LNDAYVILDEAQNTTEMQMKMFLTRLGRNAKAIVNGDVTQIDLDPPGRSGLLAAQRILSDIEGIAFVQLTQDDVVRHRLVQRIINAFDARERPPAVETKNAASGAPDETVR
jgi:phosphate starvation-inducible PhoH-like protein